jgi:hypothetical protein
MPQRRVILPNDDDGRLESSQSGVLIAKEVESVTAAELVMEDVSGDLPTAPHGLKWPVWLAIVIVGGTVIWMVVHYWTFLSNDKDGVVPGGFAVVLALLLSALPSVFCVAQNVSRNRQLDKLNNIEKLPLRSTAFFQSAKTSIKSLQLVVDADYALPIFTFSFIVFGGFLAIFVGFGRDNLFVTPSVLLGGLHGRSDPKELSGYQIETFAVIAVAFMGAYVYALRRIVERINTNDLFPISLHFYSIGIVTACVAAAIFRHAIDVLIPSQITANAEPLLLLMGFVIGYGPGMFVMAMIRKASQVLKAWGSRDEPPKHVQPHSLALWMIDDLTRDKIDRLNELGIDSAQMLARQNPFLLLPRLPYDLGLLVDWIGQAQLYELVKEEKLKKLRSKCVRDIFDLHVWLADDHARPELCAMLELPATVGNALRRQLEEDSSFRRLREVRGRLRLVDKREAALDEEIP